MANTPAQTEGKDLATGIPGIDALRLRSPRQALLWWILGLRLWRRAPLRLALLCLSPLVVEAVLQIIPIAGIVLSKVVVPLLSFGVFVVLDRVWRSGMVSLRGFLWSFRREHFWIALQAALVLMAVFALQVLMAYAVYGYAAVDAMVFGRIAAHRELLNRTFALVMILPGMVPAILLMFLMPLVVFDGVRPLRAAGMSVRLWVSSPSSFLVTCAVSSLLLGASLTWGYGLPMLFVAPWASMMGYAAYRDVFPIARPDE
jgi:hypothetical protein